MARSNAAKLLTVSDASQALGVSESTIWRLIRRGALTSVRRGGRRLIPRDALARGASPRPAENTPQFDETHPIFRLVGAGRGGGQSPGARDKHAILDR
ncbi:MAG TPA: helix-turn-helix domain-containing protein [Thermoanaerobaculia bacterium]|jgi:excisionase family DNA binding protein|nr:helix-turn-helix domain-containing protein [Thermoanaerobaculia bacterium]